MAVTKKKIVTMDAESYYGPKYSLSLQTMNLFKYVADPQFMIHGFGIKIDDQPTEYFDFHSADGEQRFRTLLAGLRSDLDPVHLLCHNTAFDAFILHYHFDWHADHYHDTLSMSRGAFPGQPADLKNLAIRLWPNDLGLRKKDDLAKTFGLRELPNEINEMLAAYCIRDVDLTYEAFKLLEPHYPDAELDLIDWTLRALVQPVLHVNRELVQQEIREQEAYRLRTIASSGVKEAVLKSDKQFCEFLRKSGVEIELKRNAKDDADIPALGQKDWPYLKMVSRHPELAPVWAARKVAKSNIQESRARWFDAVAEWNHGLMPVPINYYGAETGRWSGGEKLNLQNLPRIDPDDPASGRLRKSLIAPPGEVVIVRDLNNIEGRMLAWLAGEEYLLSIFRTDGCPYLYMAENIYNAPHGTFTKKTHGGERNVGKVACLGPDTVILTNRGPKSIISVTTKDTVWDGEQWVKHDGVVFQGIQEVETLCGVTMTPDHKILCGNNWLPMHDVALDENTLSRALERGAEAWKSLATWLANAAASPLLSSDATATRVSTLWTYVTSGRCALLVATVAQKSLGLRSDTLNIKIHSPMTTTERGCSTGCLLPLAAATTPTTKCGSITANEGSQYIRDGGTIAQRFWRTCRHFLGGMFPSTRWTGPTPTTATAQGTYDSSPGVTTPKTNGKSRTLNSESETSKTKSPVYDLLNAGPNHRFTIVTDSGPMVVHNCLGLGYGMSANKFWITVNTGPMGMDPIPMDLLSCHNIVNVYRSTNNNIVNYWGDCNGAISFMATLDPGEERAFGPLTLMRDMAVMPNGMALQYSRLYGEPNSFGGTDYFFNGTRKIYGAHFTENVSQALSRVLLGEQKLTIQRELDSNYGRDVARIVHSVHDELLTVAPERLADEIFAMKGEVMSRPPSWAPDLPLKSEGGYALEYSK